VTQIVNVVLSFAEFYNPAGDIFYVLHRFVFRIHFVPTSHTKVKGNNERRGMGSFIL